jgi:hypothetical protein
MPLTPIHLGPGIAIKSALGNRFSFMVFGGAQVLMDIEPLIGIIRGKAVLHGYTHTILGALIIGLVAGVIGRPISAFTLKLLKIKHQPFTWTSSFWGAFTGTFSHIGLDAVMHGDMSPLWPIAQGNKLLGVVSIGWLHLLCLGLGLLGVLIIAGKAVIRGKA